MLPTDFSTDHPLPTTHCPLPIRLFDPDGQATAAAGYTLASLYRRLVRPALLARQASPRYVQEVDRSVGLWTQLTGDPPLAGVEEFLARQFVEALAARPGVAGPLSPNTIRKHCRHLQPILDLAGPRSRDNPEGPARDGLFGHDEVGGARWAPRLKPPAERIEEPTEIFSLEEIGHWLEACQHATLPKLPGVDPAAWWRALVTFAYNTGLRIDTLVRVRWEHVEGRWLVVPAALMKRRRRGARIYLNRPALAAARNIRTGGEPRLFAWPVGLQQLQRARRRILDRSRIEPRRRFGFHALRRALLSWLTARNPAVAKLQAGHVGGDVTLRYYVSPAIVGRFLERVPQPAVLEPSAPDPQGRLFV